MVGQMRSLTSASLVAEIGPHICADCYVVGEEIAAEFGATHPNAVWRRDELTLDLGGALEGRRDETLMRWSMRWY